MTDGASEIKDSINFSAYMIIMMIAFAPLPLPLGYVLFNVLPFTLNTFRKFEKFCVGLQVCEGGGGGGVKIKFSGCRVGNVGQVFGSDLTQIAGYTTRVISSKLTWGGGLMGIDKCMGGRV